MTIIQSAWISGNVIVSDDTIHEVKQMANLQYLGSGISREVYALDENYVLKITRGYYRDCNTTERDCWLRIAGTSMAEHFAPVVACSPSGEWLVMERAEEKLSNWDFAEWSNTIAPILNRAGCSDLHGGNVMSMRDGSVKVIDYGFDSLNPDGFVSGSFQCGDYSNTCRCAECLADRSCSRHMLESCSHRKSQGHDSCERCDVSACVTPSCRWRRDTEMCAANSHCNGNLAGYWESPEGSVALFCQDHLPIPAPNPCSEEGHVRMFWQLSDRNIARVQWDEHGIRRVMRTF